MSLFPEQVEETTKIDFDHLFHCRQNLRVTIVIRRFCLYLVKLDQNRNLELDIITYRKCQQANLRSLAPLNLLLFMFKKAR